MKQLYLAITILLQSFGLVLFSQKTYTWHYNLSPQAAKKLYQQAALDTLMLTAELPNTSFDTLPISHHLTLENQAEKLAIKLDPKLNYSLRAMPLDKDFAIQLIDASGKEVHTAKVSLDGLPLTFNSDLRAYVKKNFLPRSGKIELEIQGHTFYYHLNSSIHTPSYTNRALPKPIRTNALRGYIAFCKPVFRHRDTLKAKIYAAEPNGRPYKGNLKLELATGKIWWDTVVSVEKGAFSFSFPLPDSLPLDQEYTLFARAIDRIIEVPIKHTFYLEDYQLQEAQYNFYASQNQFHAGEKVQLHFVARTAYQTPIRGVKIQLTAYSIHPKYNYASAFWRFSGLLNEEGELLLDIPEKSLPSTRCRLRFEVSFLAPGFALQQKEIILWYDPVAIDFKFVNGHLKAFALGKTYQVWAEHTWGRQLLYSGEQAFTTPINPYAKAYAVGFNQPESFIGLDDVNSFDLNDQIRCESQRSNTTRSISLHNPLRISIWYQIGYKNEILQKGWTQDSLFYWEQEDKTPKDLYLEYRYWWGNTWQTKRWMIPQQGQKLQVEWLAPEHIYPGQNLDLQLIVRNKRGVPQAGIDLTAGAINGQFGTATPYSPLTLAPEQLMDEPYWQYSTTPIRREWQQPLDIVFYKKLNALKAETFYRYRFIETGFLSENLPLPDTPFLQQNAFFAPFVVENNKIQGVAVVYADGTPLYFGGNAVSTPYNFSVSPGYHCIGVRTKDGLYQIDSVDLKPGFKHNLILDASSFKQSSAAKQLYFFSLPDTLTTVEKQELAPTMLCSQVGAEHFYIWDQDKHSYSWYKKSLVDVAPTYLGPLALDGKINFIQPFLRQQHFVFSKDSIPPTLFKIAAPREFNRFEIRSCPSPATDDPFEIPITARSGVEAYQKTGFGLAEITAQAYSEYCLPHGKNGLIKGRIVTANGEGISYPSIWTKAGRNELGADADNAGYFELQLPNLDEYIVKISYLNHHERSFRTCLTDSSFFSDIVLHGKQEALLKEVVINGYRGSFKTDTYSNYSTSTITSKDEINRSSRNSRNIPNLKIPKISFQKKQYTFAENPPTNGIRSKFSDYAFWEPTLLSDSEGRAVFSVKFPDNITTWSTFAIGVDDHGNTGLGRSNIAAFKPLQAQLFIPRFLVVGDQVKIQSKVSNLMSKPALIHTYFKQDEKVRQDSNWVASKETNLSHRITVPKGKDSLSLEFGLQNGSYIDGEFRQIPIFPTGRLKPFGQVIEITQDTLLTLPFEANTAYAKLTLEPGSILKLLLNDIKYLQEYEFNCNEQTASKLTALLLEKSLRSLLGEKFISEHQIFEGIAILEARQLDVGGWAWWKNGEQKYWTTNYVLSALLRAADAGYPVKAMKKGLQFLQSQLSQMNDEDYLLSLETLTKAGVKVDLARLQKEPVGTSQDDLLHIKLLRQQLLQAHQLPYSLDTLFKYRRTTANGGSFWAGREIFGFSGYRIADCSTQNTLIAYTMLKKTGQSEELRKIRRYFLSTRGFYEGNYRYGGSWNNTMEVAKILEAILPDVMEEEKQIVHSKQVKKPITSTHPELLAQSEPLTMKLLHSDTFLVKIPANQTSVYLTYVQYHTQQDSISSNKNTQFFVRSYFESHADVLKQNTPANLRVNVEVRQAAQYLMIEIPIPAGCTYFNKNENRGWYEVHREYHADRVVIFCDHLPLGNHTFGIQLLPQFTGKFTLKPVWVEDMYHPLSNGTNQLRKVIIQP